MRLTDEEQRMLDGEYGKAVQKSMKVLVTLGKIYGADRMLEVKSVHAPGVSYRVTGDAGLNYVKEASEEAKFRVPMTLNTIGIDSENWEKMGFPEDFAKKQIELSEAYEKMGAIPMNSCTPYLNGHLPMKGEHVAWGESSAIAFVNSVIGARTNREGGPTALAAALTGRIPNYGYHLDENRVGTHLVKVEIPLKTDKDFAVLGYYAGSIVKTGVPVFEGITERPRIEALKAMGAALASSGGVALYHIIGITPEAQKKEDVVKGDLPVLTFGQAEYDKVCEKFAQTGPIDFVVIGCPHVSIQEMTEVARLVEGKKIKTGLWVCTSRMVKELGDKMGITKVIEDAGGEIVCDTCPVLCYTLPRGYKTVATNSGKMAHYAPGLWNMEPVMLNTEECIQVALEGKWEGR